MEHIEPFSTEHTSPFCHLPHRALGVPVDIMLQIPSWQTSRGKVSHFVVLHQAILPLTFSLCWLKKKGCPLSLRVYKRNWRKHKVFISPSPFFFCPSVMHCHGSPSSWALIGLFWAHRQIWQPDSYVVCLCPCVSRRVWEGFLHVSGKKQWDEVKLSENQSIKMAMTSRGKTKAREDEREEERGVTRWIIICILSLATVNDDWLESLSDVFMP